MKQNPAVKTGYFQNPGSIEKWMKQNPAVKTGYFQNPGSVEAKFRPGKQEHNPQYRLRKKFPNSSLG